jgi:hypothetical protein
MYEKKSSAAAHNKQEEDAQLLYTMVFASSRFAASFGASRIRSAESGRLLPAKR